MSHYIITLLFVNGSGSLNLRFAVK